MKKTTIIQLLLIAITTVFLIIFYQFSLNGRYLPCGEKAEILDTRTGTMYIIDDDDKEVYKYRVLGKVQ